MIVAHLIHRFSVTLAWDGTISKDKVRHKGSFGPVNGQQGADSFVNVLIGSVRWGRDVCFGMEYVFVNSCYLLWHCKGE